MPNTECIKTDGRLKKIEQMRLLQKLEEGENKGKMAGKVIEVHN